MKLETQMIPQVILKMTPDEARFIYEALGDDDTSIETHSKYQEDIIDEFIENLQRLSEVN